MDLSDAELKTLRWFLNQAHNEVIWALNDTQHNRHHDIADFNPCGVEEHAETLKVMDADFEDSFAWLASGRTPWSRWWF